MSIEDSMARMALTDNDKILDKYEHRLKNDEMSIGRVKTTRDKSQRATVENVLDPRTMRFVRALRTRGVIRGINGCISTGKEANVYHAWAGEGETSESTNSDPEDSEIDTEEPFNDHIKISNNENLEFSTINAPERAVKIYKTSILVFKDRERYVDGEYRFRHSRNNHNPRKMIKIWAEKEFRNLKRIYQSGVIPVPQPFEVKHNVLVMEYLSREDKNGPSPKLRDYAYKSQDEVAYLYHTMVVYMRLMYQICRLVHADLSEYNTVMHRGKLYIIDVSQSVEPEHPLSLDFLRMDIKNVNGYFAKLNVPIFPERVIFQFVISEHLDKFSKDYNSVEDLIKYVNENLPIKNTKNDEAEDEVFRSLYLVRNLEGLEERDFDRFTEGKFDLLKSLIAQDHQRNLISTVNSEDIDHDIERETNLDETGNEETSQDSDEIEEEEEEADDETDENSEFEEREDDGVLKGKKFEDKDEKKKRKQEAKEDKRERRKTKVKKHLKKKFIKKTKSKR